MTWVGSEAREVARISDPQLSKYGPEPQILEVGRRKQLIWAKAEAEAEAGGRAPPNYQHGVRSRTFALCLLAFSCLERVHCYLEGILCRSQSL